MPDTPEIPVVEVPGFLNGLRDAVMFIYSILGMGRSIAKPWQRYRDMCMCVWYTSTVTHTRKRRTPMDIPAMVQGWHQAILAMSTGHDKTTVDHAEFAIEELMLPLLAAPVKQLREFWNALERTLQADPRVPFVVWKTMTLYGEGVVRQAKDQAIITLKTQLAQEIAELVEKDIQPDILEALVGALKWRDPATLEAMKTEIAQGAKPRLRGRESCLFLCVGPHEVML